MRASLFVSDLHFTWPDGATVFHGLDLAIGPGRHGPALSVTNCRRHAGLNLQLVTLSGGRGHW